ncbi:MAG: cupin domain-containing protein [Caulobacteraceae bacterium]|nr:cupin domain-containing protein [Caulobacteraceae bacterium]
MRTSLPMGLMAALTFGSATFAAAPIQSTPLATATTTWSGQPLNLPQGPIELKAARVVMPVGTALAPHKHPYPRYVHIESGRLSVSNEVTGVTREFGPGEFIVEAIDQWHSGRVVGDEPVILMVIDQAPPGVANVVQKPQP